MKKMMFSVSVAGLCATVIFSLLCAYFPSGAFLSLAITAGTVTYHFIMRLAVGYAVKAACKNGISHECLWFRERGFEKKLYHTLKVRKWKKYMPTFNESEFSFEENSLKGVIAATCRAETVHEIIAALSFVPLLAIPVFGDAEVFWITSVVAAVIDLSFVVMQRYNRPRLVKAAKRKGEI